MELAVLAISMLLSFALGAYLREPFPLWKRHILPERAVSIQREPYPKKVAPIDVEDTKENRYAEQRMQELLNAWNYNGAPQKEVKDNGR